LALAIRRRRSSLGDLKVACWGVADLREAFCEISEEEEEEEERLPNTSSCNPWSLMRGFSSRL
jgi:hypothetical protein